MLLLERPVQQPTFALNNHMTASDQAKLEHHDLTLFGRNGEPGIAHKVGFMWRIHVWVLCAGSGMVGYGFHWMIETFGKH